jgi:hypothetical protein
VLFKLFYEKIYIKKKQLVNNGFANKKKQSSRGANHPPGTHCHLLPASDVL